MQRTHIKREIKKLEQKAVEDQCRSQRIKKKIAPGTHMQLQVHLSNAVRSSPLNKASHTQ